MDTEVDDELNLESLQLLKQVFEAADEDGSGELDIDEFCAKLGPHLGLNLTRQQVAQLFMKIDADAGGTVDWDEFTNFMFLEKVQAGSADSATENWRLFPQEFRDKNESSSYHHDQVDRLYYYSSIDKYISCGRDGSFRLWNAAELKHAKTVSNGSSWITDCLYMPLSRKMVFTTVDRAISYYDINRGSYDLIGRVYASGAMGVPMCLNVLSGDSGERVVYGDTKGCATLLLCGSRELPARDLISTEQHKDYIYLHKEHTDWVSKIEWIPEVGLVTCSLDTTIKTFDINRERISHICTHHTKGVHSFVWCKAYSLFASCGLERDIMIWQGTTGRKMGELRGHTSSVTHIALDDNINQLFSLSVDKVIKVWDLRNHKCLQTISEDDWARHDESKPTCLYYDGARRRLVTATNRPYVWHHKVVTQDRTGHREPLRGALYNCVFHVVVSADEGGTVCVWNMQDGSRQGRFSHAHGESKITALSFDKNQRRLVTAANDATLKMWNFNNGSLLRCFEHNQEQLEVTAVLFARDEKRGSDAVYAAGWNCKVFVWEDQDEDVVDEYRTFEGHREDILSMAAYPSKALLATGDYEGRIYIWNLFTGERKSWLCHRAERYETSVDRLLWVPGYSRKQRREQAATAAALAAKAAAALASSPAPVSPRVNVHFGVNYRESGGSEDEDEISGGTHKQPGAIYDTTPQPQQQQQRHQSSNTPATGTTSNTPVPPVSPTRRGSTVSPQLYANDNLAGGSSSSSLGTATCPPPNPLDNAEQPDALLLLSAGGDGLLRVWQINQSSTGQLVCTLPGSQGHLELVTASCVDVEATTVVLGDSAGHVRVYDIADGIDTSSFEACSSSFKQRAHWLAHSAGVSSVDFIRGMPYIVTSSRDTNVALWTLDGGLIGVFGEHSWYLDDPGTWVDPQGVNRRPPLAPTDGLYLRTYDEPAATSHRASATAGAAAGSSTRLHTPAGIGHDDTDDGVPKAITALQERKQRHREAMVAKPEQPHCRLDLHDVQDVSVMVNDLLKSAAEKRRAKQRAFSHSYSTNSHFSSWSGMSHFSKPASTYRHRA